MARVLVVALVIVILATVILATVILATVILATVILATVILAIVILAIVILVIVALAVLCRSSIGHGPLPVFFTSHPRTYWSVSAMAPAARIRVTARVGPGAAA
jgi:hypothetical protein